MAGDDAFGLSPVVNKDVIAGYANDRPAKRTPGFGLASPSASAFDSISSCFLATGSARRIFKLVKDVGERFLVRLVVLFAWFVRHDRSSVRHSEPPCSD